MPPIYFCIVEAASGLPQERGETWGLQALAGYLMTLSSKHLLTLVRKRGILWSEEEKNTLNGKYWFFTGFHNLRVERRSPLPESTRPSGPAAVCY